MKKLLLLVVFGGVSLVGSWVVSDLQAADQPSPVVSLVKQAGDTNGDGAIDVSDVVYLLSWLYLGGPAPVSSDCVALDPIEGVHLLALGDGGGAEKSEDEDDVTKVRWDIISVDFSMPPGGNTVNPGGKASATAHDGFEITMTGSGTFRIAGKSQKATGGGTWEMHDQAGALLGSGTYAAKKLISFDEGPGTEPPLQVDNIGNKADFRSGLAILKIKYSDDSEGILVVSCHAPVGSAPGLFEGITATKGFVDFFHAEDPVPGVDANRTAFHRVPHKETD